MSRLINYKNYRKLDTAFLLHNATVPSTLPLSSSMYGCLRSMSSVSDSTSSRNSSAEGDWLHKLGDTEKMFYYGHRHGTRFGLLKLALNSRKPLSFDVVNQALMHWHRKIPVFQTVIREHEGEPFFFRPPNVEIDFKVCDPGTTTQQIVDDCCSGFDEVNGPLWNGRLRPVRDGTPCLIPEVKRDYPYQYDFYVSAHHSITDGATIITLIQPFLDIINDLIEGNTVDENIPLGDFVTNEQYGRVYSEVKAKLVKSNERMEKLKAFIFKSNKSPLLFKCFPRPVEANPSSKHLYLNIGQEQMAKFISKCKDVNITGGSGFQTIANTAVVELAQEAGVMDQSFDLSVNFTIDLRRFMAQRERMIHGCHAHTMASLITLDKSVRDNFWSNCQAIHEVNLDLIKRAKVVKQAIGRQLFTSQLTPEVFFKTSPEMTRDYAFNNLRTVDRLIHGKGKHVQITDFHGYNSIHRFIFPFMVMFYDYRGSYRSTFSYATDCLTEKNANFVAEKIESLLEYYSQ